MRHLSLTFLLAIGLIMASCEKQEDKRGGIFTKEEQHGAEEQYDLPQIEASGELIAITMSGPQTYYEYRGQGFGLQFEMAEQFANSIGARIRMEIAKDTTELLERLNNGEIDMVAMELPSHSGLISCGSRDSTGRKQWLVRSTSPQLAQALNEWWTPEKRNKICQNAFRRTTHGTTRRKMRPVMQSQEKGIISEYDNLFVKAAQVVGWDWRLIAAQCYQESGFDPHAQSWAGAKGLMQIMPATASHLGLRGDDVYNPELNIAAAARYIRELQNSFSDIQSPMERTQFVLAAYNGGAGHIRDAMALTKKNGGNPQRWSEVRQYVLSLSNPAYYRDPVVKYGYLRGTETDEYVRLIQDRWASYRGSARAIGTASEPAPSKRHTINGEHQSQVQSAEEYLGTGAITE